MNSKDVDTFLLAEFPKRKAKFIIRYGKWLHQGNENRFLLVYNNIIIGYCGIIPTEITGYGKKLKAIWWVDLIISKKYRGYGYQNILDDYIRNRPEIKLGFPNKNAAKIHRLHKWNVRSDSKIMMLPIKLIEPKNSYLMYVPLQAFIRFIFLPIIYHKSNYKPKWSKKDKSPDYKDYEKIFSSFNKNMLTTNRDEKYFINRYFDCPYKREYNFFKCNKNKNTKIYLITRKVKTRNGLIVKIVDLFGSIWDLSAVKDIINMVIADSINSSAKKITIIESNKKLQRMLILLGFFMFKKARFCFYETGPSKINYKSPLRWVIADSDNDFMD